VAAMMQVLMIKYADTELAAARYLPVWGFSDDGIIYRDGKPHDAQIFENWLIWVVI
jgi:hypothetical protein